MRHLTCLSAISVVLLGPAALRGQRASAPDRQQELEALVERLSERIAELERRLEQQEEATAAESAAAARTAEMQGYIDQLLERIESVERAAALQAGPAPPPPPPSNPQPPTDTQGLQARVMALEEQQTKRRPNELQAFWNDGLRLETESGDFKFRLGGRLNLDGAMFDAENDIERDIGENLDDGVEFRRARLAFSGLLYERLSFELEFDFAGGDASFKDVYVGLLKVPLLGDVVVGHFKEPMGLEQLTSDNWTTFMERSTATEAFTPERNTGIAIFNRALQERVTWGLGAFVETDDFGDGTFDDGLHFTGRLTGLPWYEQDGRRLLHLGASYSHQNQQNGSVQFRSRPESHLAPRFIDTDEFDAGSVNLLGTESAVVLGPFSAQGEFFQAWLDGVSGSNPDFSGYYVQAGYILTGEHRLYDKRRGVFLGVKPQDNFDVDGCGWGAWETAARYSSTNLDDGSIDGGQLDDFTFGLNWYLNPNARIMFNYVLADLEDAGYTQIFQWRFQLNL